MKLFTILFLLGLSGYVYQTTLTYIESRSLQIGNQLLESSTPPFELTDGSLFYQNLAYDIHDRTVLDFFMPNSNSPQKSALVVMIHGGSFTSGNKEKKYGSKYHQELIKKMTSNNVAVATLNYRYVQKNDKEGIIKCFSDCQRALQFLRYYADSLNIDPSRVVLSGASAGAGTALYIGLRDNMADQYAKNPILRQSTRVRGVVATATQAHYNIPAWPNTVFKTYQNQGFDLQKMFSLFEESRVNNLLGISSMNEYNNGLIKDRVKKLTLLDAMSPDDPQVYIANQRIPNEVPTNSSQLLHHPLHASILKQRADSVGLKSQFYIPEMDIDTRNGESVDDFILRVLK